MKHALILALAMATAIPAAYVAPTPAEAQVLAGRNAARAARRAPEPPPPPPGLTRGDERRMNAAYDDVSELDMRISELETAIGGGTPSDRQARQLADWQTRRERAQAVIAEMDAKMAAAADEG